MPPDEALGIVIVPETSKTIPELIFTLVFVPVGKINEAQDAFVSTVTVFPAVTVTLSLGPGTTWVVKDLLPLEFTPAFAVRVK